MSSKKLYYIMLVLLVISVGSVGAVTYAGSKFMLNQSTKLADLKLENQLLEQQSSSLAKAKKDIQQYSELNNIAKQIVPQDKDQARAVRELYDIAKEQNIKISGITFPSSDIGTAEKNRPGSTQTQTPPQTTVPSTSKISQAEAVTDIPGVFKIQINVTIDSKSSITYPQLIAFLERLENNRRTAQVSNISIQPNSLDRNMVSFNLTLLMYTKP